MVLLFLVLNLRKVFPIFAIPKKKRSYTKDIIEYGKDLSGYGKEANSGKQCVPREQQDQKEVLSQSS